MASKIKVDQIEGSAGSSITIPSGQTLSIADGLSSSSLPTVPVSKGGTGLTSLGSAGQSLKVNSGATALEFGDAPSGVLKKQHYFENSTRVAGNSNVANQFTWTTSFVPLDPANNDLYVQSIVPTLHAGNDYAGYGLRFSKSGGSDYDFFGRGVQYVDAATMYQSIQSQTFNIPAGTLAAGTYTIYHRTETADSNSGYYNPNSSEHSRLATQTRSTLMISEWKN